MKNDMWDEKKTFFFFKKKKGRKKKAVFCDENISTRKAGYVTKKKSGLIFWELRFRFSGFKFSDRVLP